VPRQGYQAGKNFQTPNPELPHLCDHRYKEVVQNLSHGRGSYAFALNSKGEQKAKHSIKANRERTRLYCLDVCIKKTGLNPWSDQPNHRRGLNRLSDKKSSKT
jgi:hypothetical protein